MTFSDIPTPHLQAERKSALPLKDLDQVQYNTAIVRRNPHTKNQLNVLRCFNTMH